LVKVYKNFYKFCPVCNEYFPVDFLALDKFCSICKVKPYIFNTTITNQENYINNIKKTRNIKAETFDIYDLNLSLLIVNLDYCDNDITILRKTYVSRGVK